MYLKDLVEGVDENTINEKRANFDRFFKNLDYLIKKEKNRY